MQRPSNLLQDVHLSDGPDTRSMLDGSTFSTKSAYLHIQHQLQTLKPLKSGTPRYQRKSKYLGGCYTSTRSTQEPIYCIKTSSHQTSAQDAKHNQRTATTSFSAAQHQQRYGDICASLQIPAASPTSGPRHCLIICLALSGTRSLSSFYGRSGTLGIPKCSET
jgi:hypothetical protein